MPLAVVVAGANRHDMKLTAATLDHIMVERPVPSEEHPQHLCLDAGYDYDTVYEIVRAYQYQPHIRPNQQHATPLTQQQEEPASALEATKHPRRWVVERLHSWLNRSRRLLVRWEKLIETYEAFLHLACGLLCFQHCDRFRSLEVSE
jgi:putative transposase